MQCWIYRNIIFHIRPVTTVGRWCDGKHNRVNDGAAVGNGLCRYVSIAVGGITCKASAVSNVPVKGCSGSCRCDIDRRTGCPATNSLWS